MVPVPDLAGAFREVPVKDRDAEGPVRAEDLQKRADDGLPPALHVAEGDEGAVDEGHVSGLQAEGSEAIHNVRLGDRISHLGPFCRL